VRDHRVGELDSAYANAATAQRQGDAAGADAKFKGRTGSGQFRQLAVGSITAGSNSSGHRVSYWDAIHSSKELTGMEFSVTGVASRGQPFSHPQSEMTSQVIPARVGEAKGRRAWFVEDHTSRPEVRSSI